MTIGDHLETFAGYRVLPWEPGDALADPATHIHRIALDYDEERSWVEKFRTFLSQPGARDTRGLVVGVWHSEMVMDNPPVDVVEAIVSARGELPNLRALFIGDITFEESEISWISQTDLSPILNAYPDLEHLGVRGGNDLSLGSVRLPSLRTLVIQSGGLDASVVREVMNAHLPNLEHLELYFGAEEYGATATPEDVTPLLSGTLFPKLRYLGLRDSDRADEYAQVVANAPVMEHLDVLDLSLGTLSDDGARALLESPFVRGLRRLDVHHHWCSDETVERLRGLGIDVDASDQQDLTEDWRFVAIGE
ncbi:STM4015 family protein [Deinococcus pimensis]|uniref:STM4015 family protein n=1 Tax=Deinococcus pimensis TaxID=309888 RepID=UPI000482D298|nr:STM4015 family protein [Deinococcus pimensis]